MPLKLRLTVDEQADPRVAAAARDYWLLADDAPEEDRPTKPVSGHFAHTVTDVLARYALPRSRFPEVQQACAAHVLDPGCPNGRDHPLGSVATRGDLSALLGAAVRGSCKTCRDDDLRGDQARLQRYLTAAATPSPEAVHAFVRAAPLALLAEVASVYDAQLLGETRNLGHLPALQREAADAFTGGVIVLPPRAFTIVGGTLRLATPESTPVTLPLSPVWGDAIAERVRDEKTDSAALRDALTVTLYQEVEYLLHREARRQHLSIQLTPTQTDTIFTLLRQHPTVPLGAIHAGIWTGMKALVNTYRENPDMGAQARAGFVVNSLQGGFQRLESGRRPWRLFERTNLPLLPTTAWLWANMCAADPTTTSLAVALGEAPAGTHWTPQVASLVPAMDDLARRSADAGALAPILKHIARVYEQLVSTPGSGSEALTAPEQAAKVALLGAEYLRPLFGDQVDEARAWIARAARVTGVSDPANQSSVSDGGV